jgi:CDGSH-type Zn-finger protein/uncharacterized Fe-S cluster protein YjdI
MSDAIEEYRGQTLLLRFEGRRCVHARHCVLGAPAVFKANVAGPWIDPDAASVEALIGISHACPSGAITYERLDGGAAEAPPPVNTVRVRENGPLAVHADLHIDGEPARIRSTLCRCGQSAKKPYCDGSHNEAHFAASGEAATVPTEPLAQRGGPLAVSPQPDGPLLVKGCCEVLTGTGRTILRSAGTVAFCRCGQSRNKPYCDGTHKAVGFRAP